MKEATHKNKVTIKNILGFRPRPSIVSGQMAVFTFSFAVHVRCNPVNIEEFLRFLMAFRSINTKVKDES